MNIIKKRLKKIAEEVEHEYHNHMQVVDSLAQGLEYSDFNNGYYDKNNEKVIWKKYYEEIELSGESYSKVNARVTADCSGSDVNIELAYFINPGEKLYINSKDVKEIIRAVNKPENVNFEKQSI